MVITSVTTQERTRCKSTGRAEASDISDDTTLSPKTGTPPSGTQRKRSFEALTPSPPRGHVNRKRSMFRTAPRASNANGSVGPTDPPRSGLLSASVLGDVPYFVERGLQNFTEVSDRSGQRSTQTFIHSYRGER